MYSPFSVTAGFVDDGDHRNATDWATAPPRATVDSSPIRLRRPRRDQLRHRGRGLVRAALIVFDVQPDLRSRMPPAALISSAAILTVRRTC
jgi:hypothetical protein